MTHWGIRKKIVEALEHDYQSFLPNETDCDLLNDFIQNKQEIIKELKNKHKLSDYRTAAYGIAIKKLEKSYLELGLQLITTFNNY